MKISIIVPVYNTEKYLEQCIESILNQTYRNIEIILVNDGSEDSSLSICEYYANMDSRVILLQQENRGVSAARNRGIDVAKGEFISFVDSDDWIDEDLYEILLKDALEKRKKVVICSNVIEYRGRKFIKKISSSKEYIDLDFSDTILALFREDSVIGGVCGKIYRKELFYNVRFDEKINYSEDVIVNVLLFEKAQSVLYHSIPKYHYRQTSESACHTKFSEKSLDYWKGTQILYGLIKTKCPRAQDFALDCYFQCLIFCGDAALMFKGGKEEEFKNIRKEIRGIFCNAIFKKNIPINKKKQAFFMLFPYWISRKIALFRAWKGKRRRKINKEESFE